MNPVIRRGHKVTIDVLALRKAFDNGTLSPADFATAEKFLPGVLQRAKAEEPQPAKDNPEERQTQNEP